MGEAGKYEELRDAALKEVESARSLDELEKVRVKYLGRKGELTRILRGLKDLNVEERKRVGSFANRLKQELTEKIEARKAELDSGAGSTGAGGVDISLPGKRFGEAHRHPLLLSIQRITAFFTGLGYELVGGPEAEIDYYNFTALNIPPYHPARSMHDTFYLSEKSLFEIEAEEDELREKTREIALLRTHTSPVQIRAMLRRQPPVYIVAPGKCYRKDTPDATHSPVFHQVEGLAVDEGITFADLKGTLEEFLRYFFGPESRVQFRASYFPFTEPSAEVDVSCIMCRGEGCRLCKGTGWLEVLGAGMVHPAVLEEVGYDSERYTGFAFGMGVERLAMLYHRIPDIRLFYENDLRFIKQF